MKITAFRAKDYTFTADLWTFTQVTGPDGANSLKYAFNRTIQLVTVSGTFGKMNVYFKDSEVDVHPKHQLWNLRDSDGNELSKSAVWMVDSIAPFINVWGKREGFKGRIYYFGVNGSDT